MTKEFNSVCTMTFLSESVVRSRLKYTSIVWSLLHLVLIPERDYPHNILLVIFNFVEIKSRRIFH